MSGQNNNQKYSIPITSTKFALYDYSGKIKDYYIVEQKYINNSQENIIKSSIAHSIIIIDRLASMYDDIEKLKEYLLKLLTLDEYLNSNLVITLISYSSFEDVKCHFQRIPITQIMEHKSKYQQEIKQIGVGGLTCISQSLEIAKSLLEEYSQKQKEEELTAITLHSNGFANDPNYISECRKIEKIVNNINQYNVIINTIYYSNNADFKLLAKLANLGLGKCIQADNIKQVYDFLYQTNKLLNSKLIYPLEETLASQYNYQVFVSHTTRKIIGSDQQLTIRGLTAKDQAIVYKYRKISQQEYQTYRDIPVKQQCESVFAFIQANLVQGNINLAKYALLSTFDNTLIQTHTKALTNAQIMHFSQDIERVIFNPKLIQKHHILSEIKVNNKINILELIDIFEKHQKNIIINFNYLAKNYRRKGLKRIEGERDQEQNLVKPWLKAVKIDRGKYVPMGQFKINHNTATINMLITRPVKLVTRDQYRQISEVAGVLLNDLIQYNNYTLVSNGEININTLRVKINNKKTFKLLKEKNVLTQNSKIPKNFDFTCEYDINLSDLPLVSWQDNYYNIDGIFEQLLKLQVLNSIISAHLKQESAIYSVEQVQELKKHYLSKKLYINFPTTNQYTNLEEALNNGAIDTRISYKIDLGNTKILNLSKLYSANKFLDRLYKGYDHKNQQVINKPTFALTLDKNIHFGHKTLSNKMKITEVDKLMQPIFDDFLGIKNSGIISNILQIIKADNLRYLLEDKWQDKTINKEDFVLALAEAKNKLNNYLDKLYHQKISPLVFYIGTTGLLPEQLNYQGFSAKEIIKKYPDLKISKQEKEGRFFLVGNSVITVYTQIIYYTAIKS